MIEICKLDLVDPDKRPVIDFAKRARMLRSMCERVTSPTLAKELLQGETALLPTALTLRKEQSELFAAGEYVP